MSQFNQTYYRYSLAYERVPFHKPLCNLNFTYIGIEPTTHHIFQEKAMANHSCTAKLV